MYYSFMFLKLILLLLGWFGWLMVCNAIFNNISVISWQSILLEETGVPGENHRPDASYFITKCCIEYTSPEQGSNSQH